jgi:copper chaperone CopZ
MNKTLAITGMSCGHCVSHVKSALEKVDGVTAVNVSLDENRADLTLSGNVGDSTLIAAVEAAGYQAEAR